MTTIAQEDLIQSVADALQFISYYHPADYIAALGEAYRVEESAAAKDAIAQILTNSRLCAEGHRPICQDTGIVVAFVRIGMDVRFAGATMSVTEMVNEGVRRAYLDPDNTLRASILRDPAGTRTNTKDNTPAVVHFDLIPGDTVDVRIAAKGGGSENKAKFAMLNPSDSIVDWVLKTVPAMGAGWCPPGMLGIGIGGSAEKAMVLAKEALMDPIDMHALKGRGPSNRLEGLRIELYDKVNALGIGAQGLGGLSTVLDVKILDYPTHAASLPVAIIPNCAATRHAHFTLDGGGAAKLDPPDLTAWPDVHWTPAPESRRAAVLGEFGGLGLQIKAHSWSTRSWGYLMLEDQNKLGERYSRALKQVWTLHNLRGLSAAVYTQTTDVETECNGLLTYDRAVNKIDPAVLQAANRGEFPGPPMKIVMADAALGRTKWKYTFEKPDEDWFKPAFDASGWKEGPGGFGTAGTPGSFPNTTWDTADIWLRSEFTLGAEDLSGLKLRVYHDEDASIYLNGVLALQLKGYVTEYEEFEISPEASATLRPGSNIIAVQCHQTSGGQGIDAGPRTGFPGAAGLGFRRDIVSKSSPPAQ